ncbi:MAG TPA: AAA family ATPase [Burkholderiales bacterium]|nr:AAA family ATPase [Burkholderiales bacterium]
MALYLDHFGLSETPFRITPHTDFFFDGADRGATLEALIYAVLHDEGIVKVSGEVGSGKTMLCRVLMERLPKEVETIYLATPSLAKDEIIHAIGDDLKLAFSQERRTVALRELQEHLISLYGAGRRVVILIDEAHVMPEDTLEQVRLLSNLESNRHKLLQIVLFGQPELDATLAKNELRQLRDRVTHSFRMRPLSPAEVAKYISFRMRAAGYRGPDVFLPGATAMIARASHGLTRRINILADKSLLAAFTENSHAVTERQVRAAIADSEFATVKAPRVPRAVAWAAGALVAGVVIGALIPWEAEKAPKPVAKAEPATKPATSVVAAAAVAVAATPGEQDEEEEEEIELYAQVALEWPPSHLTPGQVRKLNAYPPAGQKLLAARLAATTELLARASDEHYALELFTTDNSDPARMERFLMRARDLVPLDEVFVIPLAFGRDAGGAYRLRVVLGKYQTREQAVDAARRLPPKYQRAFQASPRTFAELRQAL